MSYARFIDQVLAQEYADAVHAELSKNKAYIATRWSDVITGSDGAYYVNANPAVEVQETVSEIPNIEQNGEN